MDYKMLRMVVDASGYEYGSYSYTERLHDETEELEVDHDGSPVVDLSWLLGDEYMCDDELEDIVSDSDRYDVLYTVRYYNDGDDEPLLEVKEWLSSIAQDELAARI